MNINDPNIDTTPVDSDALTCPRCKTLLLAAQTYPNVFAMAEAGTAELRDHYAIFHPTDDPGLDVLRGGAS